MSSRVAAPAAAGGCSTSAVAAATAPFHAIPCLRRSRVVTSATRMGSLQLAAAVSQQGALRLSPSRAIAACQDPTARRRSCSSINRLPYERLDHRRRGGTLIAAVVSYLEAAEGTGKPSRPKKDAVGDDSEQPYDRGMAVDTSPDVVELGAPPLPRPAGHQQTLIRSFTLGGIGLHTGEYAFVRVRPAFAGEGRYFVLVNEGTNAARFRLEKPQEYTKEDLEQNLEDPLIPEIEAEKEEVFSAYVREKLETGFQGSFMDWLEATENTEMLLALEKTGKAVPDWTFDNPEPPMPREERVGEEPIEASVENIRTDNEYATDLVNEDLSIQIMSVELLLAALEACGIDNARIEIEGGAEVDRSYKGQGLTAWRVEVPILDGSALGWTIECQFAGVRPAPLPPATPEEAAAAAAAASAVDQAPVQTEEEEDEEGEGAEDEDEDGEDDEAQQDIEGLSLEEVAELPEPEVAGAQGRGETILTRKEARMIGEIVCVQEGTSFITLYPEPTPRLTVGIDYSYDALVIGKQWHSYAPLEDVHFRFELASARGFVARREHLLEMRDKGMVQGGSEGVLLIGFDGRWYDPTLVRYVKDEPVRHMMVKLIGHLALLAPKGGMGMPVGHIVAYRPDTALMTKFIRAVAEEFSGPDFLVAAVEVNEEQVEEWARETEEEREAYFKKYAGRAPLVPKGEQVVDASGQPLPPAGDVGEDPPRLQKLFDVNPEDYEPMTDQELFDAVLYDDLDEGETVQFVADGEGEVGEEAADENEEGRGDEDEEAGGKSGASGRPRGRS